MHILALIPARGGSKSVPRKNLRPLHGKPLIAYSIEHACNAKLVTRVVVTTDDEEIASVARRHGAEVPFLRPAALAGDLSLDIDYHRHALDWLEGNEGYVPEMVVNLRPTHPVRTPGTIDRAIRLFAAHPEADSLRSVLLADRTPFKMWRMDADGYLVPVAFLEGVAEPYNMPRQSLPLVYWQSGYIDITRPRVIRETNSTTGRRILSFLIEGEEHVDIDYEDAIARAEALLAGDDPDEKGTQKAGPRYPS